MPTTGSTVANGYGAAHKRERKAWQQRFDRGEVITCRRAGNGTCRAPNPIIRPDEPWDLGHPDAACPLPKAPEHRGVCNRATGTHRVAAQAPTRWVL